QHIADPDTRGPTARFTVALVLGVTELRAKRIVDRRHVANPRRIAVAGRLVLRLELLHLQLGGALLYPRRPIVGEAGFDETLNAPLLELLGGRRSAAEARRRSCRVDRRRRALAGSVGRRIRSTEQR